MAIRTELSLQLQNSPGALADFCQVLSQSSVNIVALGLEAGGVLRVVVDNHVHAIGALRERQYEVEERDVLYVQMPNSPGSLATIGRLLASADINLDYAYGSSYEGDQISILVLGVPDAQRAAAAAGL